MGKDDYSSTGGGLKLKGSKPSGIEKKRKKKVPTSTSTILAKETSQEKPGTSSTMQAALLEEHETISREVEKIDGEVDTQRNELDEIHKTEAERRHEEMRRKRLNDRLKKEGLKTHKERVEELNKYLSGLSEHHDMYVLGLCSIARFSSMLICLQAENWTRLRRRYGGFILFCLSRRISSSYRTELEQTIDRRYSHLAHGSNRLL